MVSLSNNDCTSLDANSNADFNTLVHLDKEPSAFIKDLVEGSSDLEAVNKITSLATQGYVVARNDSTADIVESAMGFTSGGYILVTKIYVAIAYTSSNSFKWYKTEDAELNLEFDQVSPKSYISCDAAKVLGLPPQSYVALDGMVACSFGHDVRPLNLPSFSSCFLKNGIPLMLSGVVVGSLAPNFIASTRKGGLLNVIQGYAASIEEKRYADDECIVLTTSKRTKVKKFIEDIKAGATSDYGGFCLKYRRPDSITSRLQGSVGCIAHANSDTYSAAQQVVFTSANGFVGVGLRDYINQPCLDNCYAVDSWSTDVDFILTSYRAFLSQCLAKAFYTLNCDALRTLGDTYKKVLELRFKIDDEINVDLDGSVFCPVGSTGYKIRLVSNPSRFLKKIDDSIRVALTQSDLDAASSDPETMALYYEKIVAGLCNFAKVIEPETARLEIGDTAIEVFNPIVSESKFKEACSEYSQKVKEFISKLTGDIMYRMADGSSLDDGLEPELYYRWSCSFMDHDSCRHSGIDSDNKGEGSREFFWYLKCPNDHVNARVVCDVKPGTNNPHLDDCLEYAALGEADAGKAKYYLRNYNKVTGVSINKWTLPSKPGEKTKMNLTISFEWLGIPSYNAQLGLSSLGSFWKDYLQKNLFAGDKLRALDNVTCSARGRISAHGAREARETPWYTSYRCRCKAHNHSEMCSNVIRDGYHAESSSPVFRFDINLYDVEFEDLELMWTDDESERNLRDAMNANKLQVNKISHSLATKKLVKDLDEAGLLEDVQFIGQIGSSKCDLFDAFNLSNMDADATLPVLLDGLYDAIEAKDENGSSAYSSDPGKRYQLQATLAKLVNGAAQNGLKVYRDNATSSYVVERTKEAEGKPWLMDLKSFNPVALKVDCNLLGLYMVV